MRLQGKINIYKIIDGRVTNAYKPNAITYNGRNTMMDVLSDGSTPLKYLMLLNIDSNNSGNRAYLPTTLDYVLFSDDTTAIFDLSTTSLVIGSFIATIGATKSYSAADAVYGNAYLKYTIEIPDGLLKNGEQFNCIAIFDNTADPSSAITSARLFSFAVLDSPIIIAGGENIVINYGYEIR